MTLHGLQSATLSQTDSTSDASVPEELTYEDLLRQQGIRVKEVSNDLNAAGWDPLYERVEESELHGGFGDVGGSPVVFNRDE